VKNATWRQVSNFRLISFSCLEPRFRGSSFRAAISASGYVNSS
jgi:hypothetical protein